MSDKTLMSIVGTLRKRGIKMSTINSISQKMTGVSVSKFRELTFEQASSLYRELNMWLELLESAV